MTLSKADSCFDDLFSLFLLNTVGFGFTCFSVTTFNSCYYFRIKLTKQSALLSGAITATLNDILVFFIINLITLDFFRLVQIFLFTLLCVFYDSYKIKLMFVYNIISYYWNLDSSEKKIS